MFLILEAAGAKLTIAEGLNKSTVVSVADYLYFNMDGKIILNVILPALSSKVYTYRSYKVLSITLIFHITNNIFTQIMPRAQNAHAYVNAGFLFKFDKGVIKSARLCFGGINPEFVHANETEKFLIGKDLYNNETLQEALKILTSEIQPDWVLPDASPDYRKNLAAALFYKCVLNTCPSYQINREFVSGGTILERPLSSGKHFFDTFVDRYPLTEKVPKYEGLIQCSGELKYINDINPMKR